MGNTESVLESKGLPWTRTPLPPVSKVFGDPTRPTEDGSHWNDSLVRQDVEWMRKVESSEQEGHEQPIHKGQTHSDPPAVPGSPSTLRRSESPRPITNHRSAPQVKGIIRNALPIPTRPSSGVNLSKTENIFWSEGNKRTSHRTTNAAPDAGLNLDEKLERRALNLVCYRSAAQGCKAHQIQVARPRQPVDTNEVDLREVLVDRDDLISTDERFFIALREGYERVLCSFWRRNFSLKTLRSLRLRSYTDGDNIRPVIVEIDPLVMQEILYWYHHPSQIATQFEKEGVYIDWVFNLKKENFRHLLEFVEGWSGTRIASAASIMLLMSTLVAVLESVLTGDVQTSFTVAQFILTIGTLFLALVAILSNN